MKGITLSIFATFLSLTITSKVKAEYGNTVLHCIITWKNPYTNLSEVDTFYIIAFSENININKDTTQWISKYLLGDHIRDQSSKGSKTLMLPTRKSVLKASYVSKKGDSIQLANDPFFYDEKPIYFNNIQSIHIIDVDIISGLSAIEYLPLPINFRAPVLTYIPDTFYHVAAPNMISLSHQSEMLEYIDYYTILTYDDDIDLTDSLITSLLALETGLFKAIYVYEKIYRDKNIESGFDVFTPIEQVPKEAWHIWYLVRGYREHLDWILEKIKEAGFIIIWNSGI